ncbi:MAG: N-acetylmuramoyl-L-alanine amidase [Candidatus Gastranaerophilales bacterium]|nr:N-acetylmuramoyl-L-alanine amidase [Candidatus Gastranaerophilales bacterium]
MTKISKICLHWSAGANTPCETDLNAYHYCVDKNGKIYLGKYTPEDNLNCYDGSYAKHCGGGNTGCIGISVCGMFDFDLKNKQTKYPLTQKQVEAMCEKAAELCIKYGITLSKNTVFTHYEFGQLNPKTSSFGKIDFTYLPYLPDLQKDRIGDYLRNKVQWYMLQLKK